MTEPVPNPVADVYDRRLLLLGSKRNDMLELWEVQRYGLLLATRGWRP